MKTAMLRQFWAVVETTQSQILLNLDERELSNLLLGKLDRRLPLSGEDEKVLTTYINSKASLIKDLAEARLG